MSHTDLQPNFSFLFCIMQSKTNNHFELYTVCVLPVAVDFVALKWSVIGFSLVPDQPSLQRLIQQPIIIFIVCRRFDFKPKASL